MSKPVTDSALDRAWPGSGFPNTSQSRTIQGMKIARATAAGIATSASLRLRSRTGVRQTAMSQAKPRNTASLRVRAASPIRTPRAMTFGLVRRTRPASRRIRGISRHAARASAANGIVESGRAEWRTSGK